MKNIKQILGVTKEWLSAVPAKIWWGYLGFFAVYMLVFWSIMAPFSQLVLLASGLALITNGLLWLYMDKNLDRAG